jgi:formyltetrahydrofolate deformylase
MTLSNKNTAILLISCPDQKGIITSVTNFIFKNQGNIIELEQHVDKLSGKFFMRVEWELNGFQINKDHLKEEFSKAMGLPFQMEWNIYFSNNTPKMALFVSNHAHCFLDLLARYQANEWDIKIPVVISNHLEWKTIVENLNIPFYYIPITKENKETQENIQLELMKKYEIDFIVLARYMQILGPNFIRYFPQKIINIHHSFLPAFPGAKPYHSAFERGVKIIGATSHYVTDELDTGPIIEQDITHVSHNDCVEDLIRKGKDVEKIVLSKAIWKHLNRKILVHNNRTIVFA